MEYLFFEESLFFLFILLVVDPTLPFHLVLGALSEIFALQSSSLASSLVSAFC